MYEFTIAGTNIFHTLTNGKVCYQLTILDVKITVSHLLFVNGFQYLCTATY